MIHLRWPRREAALPLLLAGALLVGACSATAGAQSATTSQTTIVQRGSVKSTVSASGTVKAAADLGLTAANAGTIKQVLVKVGDRVADGQALIALDTRDLELELQQAEANLASAQAKYDQTKAGATDKEIAQAQASVDQAQAKHQQTAQGTTTAQDIANAEAALRSAQAKLAATVAGTTTAQDIADAEAALRSAQAKLEATIAGTTTPQDIANAEAALRSAEAKLAQVKAGADASELASAQQSLSQAKDNRLKQESQLSNAKEQARIALDQAANDLRSAQQQYGAAKLIWDEAERTGKDPNIAEQKNGAKGYRDLSDAKRRQYKADFKSAELSMKNAEQAMEQKQLAYEDAKKQEIAGLQTADSQIVAAQASLDALLDGPDPQDVAQAQASVDQARASLEKLHQPAKATDVAQAQATVDQAQTSLDRLRQPAKATDVAQAQAAVDQARASLEKLQRPADANNVAQTQASLNSAQAALDDVKAGAKAPDLATALASVKQTEAARDLALAKVEDATLTAPFAGVVATVSAIPGQQASAGGSTALVTLVDDSSLSIDVRVAESDIGRVQVGQPARVTVEALPGQTIEGTVTAIAPKSTVESNVVSYLVTVSLAGQQASGIKAGMTATVVLVTASKQDVLVVPNKAVQTQGQQKVVTVSVKGEKFSAPVQIGLVGGSASEVIAGLAEGDVVVTTGVATTTTSTTRTGGGLPGFGGGAPVVKP